MTEFVGNVGEKSPPGADALGRLDRLLEVFGPALLEARAFQQLHHEVGHLQVLADVVDRDHVRVAEGGDRAGLAEEALAGIADLAVGAEDFDRDRPLELGSEAYLGANVLGFWRGELYVKLISFDHGPSIDQQLISLAEKVSARISSQGGELETLLFFPAEGRVVASERFIPKNFLGQPYLSDAYRVDYTRDGEDLQLFIVDTGSPAGRR